jgi:hypothetical protein
VRLILESVRQTRCVLILIAFAAVCSSQAAVDVSPKIGLIEIFGERKVSDQKIRGAVGVKPGDPLPPSEATEDRINKLNGILASRLQAVCCTPDRRMILYVGVEERDSPHMEFHPAPAGDNKIPVELYDNYLSLLESVESSIRGNNADEDLTNGYSLMADPYARVIQQNFIPAVEKNLGILAEVVRQSSDPEQRAAAAYLMQYGPRGPRPSKLISDTLQYALRDREDIVRKNALRGLHAVNVGAKLHPEQNIAIQPTWFVEMLNSVVWSDRRNASQELLNLTEEPKPETLALIRERALPAILEMARWKTLDHALPAFVLAGRVAGFEEKEIKNAWLKEDRESVLSELAGKKSRWKR